MEVTSTAAIAIDAMVATSTQVVLPLPISPLVVVNWQFDQELLGAVGEYILLKHQYFAYSVGH